MVTNTKLTNLGKSDKLSGRYNDRPLALKFSIGFTHHFFYMKSFNIINDNNQICKRDHGNGAAGRCGPKGYDS